MGEGTHRFSEARVAATMCRPNHHKEAHLLALVLPQLAALELLVVTGRNAIASNDLSPSLDLGRSQCDTLYASGSETCRGEERAEGSE